MVDTPSTHGLRQRVDKEEAYVWSGIYTARSINNVTPDKVSMLSYYCICSKKMSSNIELHEQQMAAANKLHTINMGTRDYSEFIEEQEKAFCKKEQAIKLNDAGKRSIESNTLSTFMKSPEDSNLRTHLAQPTNFKSSSFDTTSVGDITFREFKDCLFDEEQFKILWEALPKSAKGTYLEKARQKKKSKTLPKETYTSLETILSNKESSINKTRTKCSNSKNASRRNHDFNMQKDQLLRDILIHLIDGMPDFMEPGVGDALTAADDTQRPSNRNYETNLGKIQMWKERQEIDYKIEELNLLIKRYEETFLSGIYVSTVEKKQHTENFSKLKSSTRIKPQTMMGSRVRKISKPVTLPVQQNKKNSSWIYSFTKSIKKVLSKFKHKTNIISKWCI